MTINTSTKRRKFFDCSPGTDGCDETFDIVSRTTGHRVAWAGYWDARVPARRAAHVLTAALNTVFAGHGITFCLSALAKEQRQIAIVWNIQDVWNVRPDLNLDKAWQVLQAIDRNHDANVGVNWEVIECTAQSLFGDKPE
jgi:hypothetical protein